VEDTALQVDSVITVWMECVTVNIVWKNALQVDSGITVLMDGVTVNIVWKILHCRWTVVLQFGWSVLQ